MLPATGPPVRPSTAASSSDGQRRRDRPTPGRRRATCDVAHEPAEVLAEEAGDEGQRQEDRAEHRQPRGQRVEAVGVAREVDRRRPPRAARAGSRPAPTMRDEDVVDVAEVVARALALEARERLEQRPRPRRAGRAAGAGAAAARKSSPRRRAMSRRTMSLGCSKASSCSSSTRIGLVLDELGQTRRPARRGSGRPGRARCGRRPPRPRGAGGRARRRRSRRIVTTCSPLRCRWTSTGSPVAVGAVEDEQDLAAVVVELRALAELLGVLERQRRQLEDCRRACRARTPRAAGGRARRTRRAPGARASGRRRRGRGPASGAADASRGAGRASVPAGPAARGRGRVLRGLGQRRGLGPGGLLVLDALGLGPAGADVDEGPGQGGADERDERAEAQAAVERRTRRPPGPRGRRRRHVDAAGAERRRRAAGGARRAPGAGARRAWSGPGRR